MGKIFVNKIYNDNFKENGCIFIGIGFIFLVISYLIFRVTPIEINDNSIHFKSVENFIYMIIASEIFIAGIISIYITLNRKLKSIVAIIGVLSIILSYKAMYLTILFIFALIIFIIIRCFDRMYLTYLMCAIYSLFWGLIFLCLVNSQIFNDIYPIVYLCITGFLISYILIGSGVNKKILNKISPNTEYDRKILENHMYILYFIVCFLINISPYRSSDLATAVNNSFCTMIVMLSINKRGIFNQSIENKYIKNKN